MHSPFTYTVPVQQTSQADQLFMSFMCPRNLAHSGCIMCSTCPTDVCAASDPDASLA